MGLVGERAAGVGDDAGAGGGAPAGAGAAGPVAHGGDGARLGLRYGGAAAEVPAAADEGGAVDDEAAWGGARVVTGLADAGGGLLAGAAHQRHGDQEGAARNGPPDGRAGDPYRQSHGANLLFRAKVLPFLARPSTARPKCLSYG
ncbi:hypothetical protein GCM10020000_31460 [Streptomyces olivoverticillatus]